MTIEDRKRNARNNAQQAFWTVFASHFPEAAGGDFPPDATFAFDAAIEQATQTWLDYNVPDIASAVLTPGKTLPVASALKCPRCEYAGEEETENGGTFRYLTDQVAWREIIDLKPNTQSDDGSTHTLIVKGEINLYHESNEENDRIECRKCLAEFLLATTIEVEFV